ncbi:MAG: hypothetical protein IJ247_03735 [Bacilli bacterium]|nr:hypothetical protein [Bacilli bacterium]
MKAKYLRIASILEYVFTFVYAITTALFYSMSDNLYWMFLIFALLSLCVGLYSESIIFRLKKENVLSKKDFIATIVITVLSVVDCLPLLFNILTLVSKKESPTVVVLNENYVEKEKKERKWFKTAPIIVTAISLVGIIATAISGNAFETSGGKVIVKDGTITKHESDLYLKDQPLIGTSYTIDDPTVSISYTMYKPKEASASNQLPTVFVVPGFTRTKATMAQYAIELSRRGAIVFTIDPGSQGATTYGGYQYDDTTGEYVLDETGSKIQNSYSVARSGMGYLLPYVYNNIDEFDFVDRDNIGLVGHSAGGGDACKLAADLAGTSYEESIVKSLYISGYIKTSAANVFYQLRCNTALSYAKYDEGSFRYQDENQAYEVIALRFINEVNSKTAGANGKFTDFIQDYDYGDMETGTYRIIHHEEINHCFEMYDPLSISNTTNFFRRTLSLNTSLEDGSQTWFGKELSNGLALVFAFMLIISLTGVVIRFVPFMKSLGKAAEERKENEHEIAKRYSSDPLTRKEAGSEKVDRGIGKRLLFWLPMVLTAIIACLDYIPLARLSMDVFADAAGNIYTSYFPARMMNAVFLWAVVNGTIGLLIWVGTTLCENLYYFIYQKVKGGESRVDWEKLKGLKVKPLDLLKSLGLAIVLFFTFYGVLQLVYITSHQDFRFMLISASPLQPRFIVTWLIYLAGFYVFYLSNSLRVNLGIAREGFKEWQVMLIGALANSLGLIFIIIINYFVYFKTGTVFYGYYSPTDTNEMWLYINMVFPLIVMMAILPIFNRLSYKKMGNVYSGALLWCMIFIMMSLSASISFIPM